MNYVTHARTPQELKAEVVSDLKRRIDFLYGQHKTIARSAAEKSRIDCAIRELESMYNYWNELEILGQPIRQRSSRATPVSSFSERHEE